MNELTPLIPGFYVDGEGRVRMNMREFILLHQIKDSPAARAAIWEEVSDIFGEVEVVEISDWDLLHLSRIVRKL
jgi:hypothetical protein